MIYKIYQLNLHNPLVVFIMKLKKIFFVFGLSLISFFLYSQKPLNLEDAIQIGIENHYQIKILKNQVEIAKNNNSPGNIGLLPVITSTTNQNNTISNLNQSFFGGLRPPLVQSGVNNRNINTGLNLNYTFFAGKGFYYLKNRFKLLEDLGVNATETAVENLISSISRVYYEVVREELRLLNFQKGLEISEDRLKLAKDRYEVGQASKVDYLSAQVDYNEDYAALLAQEQALENKKIEFNTLLVRDHQLDFEINPTIALMNTLELNSIKDKAMSLNPTIISAIINLKINENQIGAIKSSYLPRIDLLSGYTGTSVRNGAGFGIEKGTSYVFNYGLRLTIPLYDGSNLKRQLKNARLNAMNSELTLNDLQNELISSIERTYLSYLNAIKLIELEEENYTIAQQNVEIAFERYRVGMATSYELREVQRNSVSAETRLIEAKFMAKTAEIELIRLSGELI